MTDEPSMQVAPPQVHILRLLHPVNVFASLQDAHFPLFHLLLQRRHRTVHVHQLQPCQMGPPSQPMKHPTEQQ